MAERRLSLAVRDAEGNRRQGEVVIVPSWRPDIERSATADFTIVLSCTPPNGERIPSDAPGLIVCAPDAPVKLPKAVAEPVATYDAGAATAPLRLPPDVLRSFAAGALLCAGPISISASEVFGNGGEPRLQLLAEHLVNGAGRQERYWRVVDEVLAKPKPPTRLPRPDRIRAKLAHLFEASPKGEAMGQPALDRLHTIADGEPPDTLYDDPRSLAEDVAFLRCLPEQPEAANTLAGMREYVRSATVGATGGLATEGVLTLEQLSFTTLLEAPHQLASLRATFDVFRDRYARAYSSHHERYWRARSRLGSTLAEAAPTAKALQGLNTLRALGAPVGVAALERYERLTSSRSDCQPTDLPAALREQPRCPQCELAIGEAPPVDEAEETLRRLRGALARQQSRLASEAVRRILARGGERLEQFLRIVQASDIAGLVEVLDDDLLSFLRDLLAQPVTPTPEALDLFDELTRAHPEVGEGDIDDAAESFRRLLRERLDANGGTIRLADDPADRP